MLARIIGLCAVLILSWPRAKPTLAGDEVRAQEGQTQPAVQDISQLQTQAERGDATAQLILAQAYERGEGVPKNGELAASWYRKAAEQGNSEAQERLGVLYLIGEG